MFSISGKKEKKNSKLKIEIKFFRSGLFLTVGRERGNKSNFIFGLIKLFAADIGHLQSPQHTLESY